MRKDKVIDTLIKPPRRIFEGGGWDKTERLARTGDAERERIVAEKYTPKVGLRGVE